MNRTTNAIARVMRLALLSLLLAAQGLAYAHEVGHLGADTGNECAVCVAGHAAGAAIPVTHEPPVVTRTAATAWRAPSADRTAVTVPCFGARAPPCHS